MLKSHSPFCQRTPTPDKNTGDGTGSSRSKKHEHLSLNFLKEQDKKSPRR